MFLKTLNEDPSGKVEAYIMLSFSELSAK